MSAGTVDISVKMADWKASSQRTTAAMEALFDALEGLTREEAEWVARRFAQLVEEAGPRRGLMRFQRPVREALDSA